MARLLKQDSLGWQRAGVGAIDGRLNARKNDQAIHQRLLCLD